MLGAIIGDLVGSVYKYDEFKRKILETSKSLEVLNKDNLIDDDSFYTENTILTIAILEAILDERPYEDVLREYGLKYFLDKPSTRASHFDCLFNPEFIEWCQGKRENDGMSSNSLTRVSPIGYLYDDFDKIFEESKKATITSHDRVLPVIAAQMVNNLIYFGRRGYSKEEVKNKCFPFAETLCGARLFNKFDSSCLIFDKSVVAFFESDSFESAIRNAVSLGGDTSSIGAITGSIAEAYYSLPEDMKAQALAKLPNEFVQKIGKGYQRLKKL